MTKKNRVGTLFTGDNPKNPGPGLVAIEENNLAKDLPIGRDPGPCRPAVDRQPMA